ncbi:MAG: LCP family protein [Clostridiales bacterium]|nr:LCP family protein [Clostridiales bacterium]
MKDNQAKSRHAKSGRTIAESSRTGETPSAVRKNGHKTRKKSVVKRAIIGVVACMVLLAAALFTYVALTLGQMTVKPISSDPDSLNIDQSQFGDGQYDDITNIALFGVDRRDGANGRSDAIMVLTVDRKNNKMKATSFLRDSFVTIEGRTRKDKLGHAYSYGGPELAIKTLNANFGLNIRDYVTIDFDSMAKVVDAVGGVTIDVQEGELESLNACIDEYCDIYNISKHTYVKQAGEQQLNGMQACGYSRVRYDHNNGDDRRRTERQRTVIQRIFEKALSLPITEYPSVAAKVLPLVETSMDIGKVLGLGTKIMASGAAEFEQARFPMDVDLTFDHKYGMAVALYDEETTRDKIHNFIFEDIDPQATKASAAD